MPKRIAITEKLLSSISEIISTNLLLNDVKEFELYDHAQLFRKAPEEWRDIEFAICEYTTRKQNEIMAGLKELLTK